MSSSLALTKVLRGDTVTAAPSLTTVGDGDTSEVATHTLPPSFSFLRQTKSQIGEKNEQLGSSSGTIQTSRIHHGFSKSH